MVTGVGTLGKMYVVKAEDKFYFKDGNIIWFKNHFGLPSNYISLIFKGSFIANQIRNLSSGTTVGTYTIISAKNTLIPLPPIEEQKSIVEKAEELLQHCDRLNSDYFKEGMLA